MQVPTKSVLISGMGIEVFQGSIRLITVQKYTLSCGKKMSWFLLCNPSKKDQQNIVGIIPFLPDANHVQSEQWRVEVRLWVKLLQTAKTSLSFSNLFIEQVRSVLRALLPWGATVDRDLRPAVWLGSVPIPSLFRSWNDISLPPSKRGFFVWKGTPHLVRNTSLILLFPILNKSGFPVLFY